MKKYIRSTSDKTYQNTRNPNKFIETRKYDDGHTVARQYMKWDTPEGEVKNYTGAKDAKRGRYYRANKDTLNSMLEDYDEVESASDPLGMTDEEYNEYFEKYGPDYMKTDAYRAYEDAHYANGDRAWKVHIGYDCGYSESGPMISGDWEVVYAPTAKAAEKIVTDALSYDDSGFCGCYAEPISDEELNEYLEELAAYDEDLPFN